MGVTLGLLERIRSALLRSDLKELGAALEGRAQAEAEAARLTAERERLLRRLAVHLGGPPEVALRRLVEALSPDRRDDLARTRERLRVLYARVDELARNTTFLAAYGLGFVRRCLYDFTGTGTPAGRYGANGTHLEASLRPLISKRG